MKKIKEQLKKGQQIIVDQTFGKKSYETILGNDIINRFHKEISDSDDYLVKRIILIKYKDGSTGYSLEPSNIDIMLTWVEGTNEGSIKGKSHHLFGGHLVYHKSKDTFYNIKWNTQKKLYEAVIVKGVTTNTPKGLTLLIGSAKEFIRIPEDLV